jgi:hypothetical protein
VKPVLTADEYRRVDKAFTGDLIQAMDRAGYAVALSAVRHGAGYGKRVAVLAGPGNNGGDGYVAAGTSRRGGRSSPCKPSPTPRLPRRETPPPRRPRPGSTSESLASPRKQTS